MVVKLGVGPTDYSQQLHCLKSVKIPRWILCENNCGIELHGFADALDLKRSDGTAELKLICSKSRELPQKMEKQKQITTPRAERNTKKYQK